VSASSRFCLIELRHAYRRKHVRRSAWSNEQVPAHMAVPLILWLPAQDVSADLKAAEVRHLGAV
jgi:hypothetical protein